MCRISFISPRRLIVKNFGNLCSISVIIIIMCCPVSSIPIGVQQQSSSASTNHGFLWISSNKNNERGRSNSKLLEGGRSNSKLLDCAKLSCEIYKIKWNPTSKDQNPSDSIQYNIITYQNSNTSNPTQPPAAMTTVPPVTTLMPSTASPVTSSPLNAFDSALNYQLGFLYKYKSFIPMIIMILAAPIVLTVITILTIHAILSYFIKKELVNRLAEAEEILHSINSASRYPRQKTGHGHHYHHKHFGEFGPFDDDEYFENKYSSKKRKGQKLIGELGLAQSGFTSFDGISNMFSGMVLPLIASYFGNTG